MTRLSLALSSFRRHRLRTLFTLASVAAAFAIFTVLAVLRLSLTGGLEYTDAQRLSTDNTMGGFLPIRYAGEIARVPGVKALDWYRGFQGNWRKPGDHVNVLYFSDQVLHVYPEFKVAPAQVAAYMADKAGAIVGQPLAARMGWKVGDTVTLQGGPPQQNGSTAWRFHIDGMYAADLPAGFQNFFIAHYTYLNDGMAASPAKNTTYEFNVLVSDPRAVSRVAARIDALFAHDSPSTRTQSEDAQTLSNLRQFGDVGLLLLYVALAVFGTMLLIAGHAMVNSVRERTGEFAMMRALGFSRIALVLHLLRESLLLIGTGAAVGLALGWELTRLMAPYITPVLRAFGLNWLVFAAGAAIALLFVALVSLLPGRRLATLSVATSLRRA
ncbi:MAG: ABC transporter permease [Rhizomicrobium sp.]